MKAKWGFAMAFAAVVSLLGAAVGAGSESAVNDTFMIDDFSTTAGQGSPTPKWEFVPGRSADGTAVGQVQVQEAEGRRRLHLTGAVSLKGGAGFIQVRWPLLSKGRPLDARPYDGIRLAPEEMARPTPSICVLAMPILRGNTTGPSFRRMGNGRRSTAVRGAPCRLRTLSEHSRLTAGHNRRSTGH